MKILVIGHPYMTLVNREKFHSLLEIQKDMEIFLIVPNKWKDPYYPGKEYNFLIHSKRLKIISLPIIFAGHGGLYFICSLKIVSIIKKIQPDVIQVDSEPHSLLYIQISIIKNLFLPNAKIIFFSWNNLPNLRVFPKNFSVNLLQRFALHCSDGAVCGNPDGANLLKKTGFKKPIEVIPQFGVNTSIYKKINVNELKKSLNLDSSFVIGYAGRIIKEKGLLTLLDALLELKNYNWKLLLIGRGELLNDIYEIASSHNIKERIVHVDVVPQDEIIKYLNCIDVLILPSITATYWKEQFGRVLIEAMSCEVPVIGSDSGAIPWVIGDAGLIFPEGDVEKLKQCILTLIQQDSLRRQLIQLGKQRVEKEFSEEVIASKYLYFYHRLLDHR